MAMPSHPSICPFPLLTLPSVRTRKASMAEEAVAAMQVLESRNVIGKCIVTMNGYTHES